MARTEGQKPFTVYVDEDLLTAMDEWRKTHGESRADFVRVAVCDRLESLGIALAGNLRFGPDRAGKGGRPKASSPRAAAATDSLGMAGNLLRKPGTPGKTPRLRE